MRRLFVLPLLLCALAALAAAAYSQSAQSAQSAQFTGAPPSAAQTAASDAPGSDWSPPTQELAPSQQADSESMGTTGTSAAPTIEWRPSADSSETDQAADEALAPRVDLAGPGAPKWRVITYVTQKTTVDDNIYISHSDKESDVYLSIAPGFAAGWGDFRSALLAHASQFSDQYGHTREPENDPLNGSFAYINYTATATHFLSHDSLDAIDQYGAISGQWDFTKVLVGIDGAVQTLAGPDIDTGGRTRRTLYNLDTTQSLSISDKTSLSFQEAGSYAAYVTQLSSGDVHAQGFMNYQIFPKTAIGGGLVAGVRTLESNPDQYYQQWLADATYEATGKLSLQMNGGLELDESTGGTQSNPIFSIQGNYSLGPQDSVSLNASKSTSSSAVTAGQTVDSTGVDLEFRHRVYWNFAVALSASFFHSEYDSYGTSALARTDNYISLRPSITYDFAEWSQLELAYEFHRNLSTEQPFDFAENLASLQINFVF